MTTSDPTHVSFPLRADARGRTAVAGEDPYLRSLIERVLLTSPGERPNRPDFGSGVLELVFSPAGPELAAASQLLVRGALQRWLGDLIEIAGVTVEAVESTITVTVAYTRRDTGQSGTATISRELA